MAVNGAWEWEWVVNGAWEQEWELTGRGLLSPSGRREGGDKDDENIRRRGSWDRAIRNAGKERTKKKNYTPCFVEGKDRKTVFV